ncbi:MAG TPA: PQ-loop domain-containing transporter [Propionibacteriaceae bacterium]|nr:PQ-loop domain-containing transporter [Propionibacteriaceae bacterium]
MLQKATITVFVQALGWAAAICGASVALPQVLRLLGTSTTKGVSLLAWQLAIAANIAWTTHGVLTAHSNVWVPNLILFFCSVLILLQIGRDRRIGLLKLFGPGVLLGVATIGIDLTVGPVAFAVAAFLPSAFAQLAQFQDLVLAPNIRGVSMPFLIMSVINQALWLGWSVLAGEVSIILCAASLGAMMTANLVWALLRSRRLVRARLAMMYA